MPMIPQETGTAKTNKLNNVTSNFVHDNLYQLTGVTQGTSTTESYTYDAVGNRLSAVGGTSYSCNASNDLLGAGPASYTYDDNGNTLTKTDASGTTAYAWDFENRLKSVTLPGDTSVTFRYDPLGRRIQKGGSIFVYDGANLIQESDQAGNLVAHYIQGPGIDQPLAAYRGAASEFYEADGLGSITSLTTTSGAVNQSYSFDSFGNTFSTTGAFVQPFRYTGREWDAETGLYYYRARYYDAAIGRFLGEDPVRFDAGSPNFYAYVGNSPTNAVDPSGLAQCVYSVAMHTLVCGPNANGIPALIGPNLPGAVLVGPGGLHSGAKDCQDQDKCTNTKDKGPIEPGNYKMNLDTRVEKRPDGTIWDHAAGGQYRLEPWPHHFWDGFFYNRGWIRGGFELHVGSITFGCINADKTNPGVVAQYQNMRALLQTEVGGNFLTVIP
ncbi:MAG TPA: RHS repeat-associated core domain-containing protein [Candidatus Saccharimonadales bacterium]|nr:RHS repeat-associated core domain-containing protein [Candidatus Saccharimonadales bacterium]